MINEIKPILLDPKEDPREFAKSNSSEICDQINLQLEELFLIRNPEYKFNPDYAAPLADFVGYASDQAGSLDAYGSWVYFPWSHKVVHILPEDEWFELLTARNKNLITKEEQKKFYDSTIAIAGLSVGSHIAITIAMMGGSRKMIIADPDEIGPTNLNRIRAGVSNLGINKALLTAQMLYEINPYMQITVYSEGVTEGNISDFFDRDPVSILVEETDNLGLKIKLREEARSRRIPVVMGTDNGDGVIIDVERYDLHTDLPLFNGAIGDVTFEDFKDFPPRALPQLATKIAGPELAVDRMKTSILEVGRTLYSWPQLGDAATLCGVVIACITRRIANNLPTKEGKFDLNLEALLDPGYFSEDAKKEREVHHKEFMKKVGLEA